MSSSSRSVHMSQSAVLTSMRGMLGGSTSFPVYAAVMGCPPRATKMSSSPFSATPHVKATLPKEISAGSSFRHPPLGQKRGNTYLHGPCRLGGQNRPPEVHALMLGAQCRASESRRRDYMRGVPLRRRARLIL